MSENKSKTKFDDSVSFTKTVGGTIAFFYIFAIVFALIYNGMHLFLDWLYGENQKNKKKENK